MSELAVAANCPELRRIFSGEPIIGVSGDTKKPRGAIWPQLAEALYQTVIREAPNDVIEIGMANGTSSLAILSALEKIGTHGSLTSIDPKQSEQAGWDGVGVRAVQRAGLSSKHTLIEERSFDALPTLLRAGRRFQFGYIDGWHTFDYTLIDFFYIDRMLDVGGIVAFNDCSWPAVDMVLRYLLSHRKYEEIDVGLSPMFLGNTKLQRLRSRLRGRQAQDRYFRKTADWEPNWDFFAPF